jgi:hypothetical protein
MLDRTRDGTAGQASSGTRKHTDFAETSPEPALLGKPAVAPVSTPTGYNFAFLKDKISCHRGDSVQKGSS